MPKELIDLRGAERTLLMSLYLHTLDARESTPVLGDTHAAEVLDRVEYDAGQFAGLAGNEELIVERARVIDDRVRTFLAAHPGTTVAHLGCGLDSRSSRLDLSSAARWLDIDLPEVAVLRRKLYPPRDGVEVLAASATGPEWWGGGGAPPPPPPRGAGGGGPRKPKAGGGWPRGPPPGVP
ncbi:MAG: class I SAM-dependent methyltransferase, partial [Pseudonocardia sp.]|nr:class I SAM-dependent methyltransferase [Pseudonocardia sp.]